jgi:uncharacterized protein (DUF885 family)
VVIGVQLWRYARQAFVDAENARQEAVRGNFDPGYLFYSIGKLIIMKLRDDWMILHPQKSPRDFHDILLGYGTMPVRLVRRAMPGGAEHCRLLH